MVDAPSNEPSSRMRRGLEEAEGSSNLVRVSHDGTISSNQLFEKAKRERELGVAEVSREVFWSRDMMMWVIVTCIMMTRIQDSGEKLIGTVAGDLMSTLRIDLSIA